MNSSPGKKMHGTLVFDLDGTLVATSDDIVFTANYVLAAEGHPPMSRDRVLSKVGHGARYLIGSLLNVDPADTSRMDRLYRVFGEHYLQHQTQRSKLYPGIWNMLDTLLKRYSLFILSNKPHPAVVREAQAHGIDGFFQSIWGAGALAHLKPDPIGIDTAIAQSGLSRGRTVMIGDMFPDIQVGHNAGVSTCLVTWGFGIFVREGETAPAPTFAVDSPEQMVPALEELLNSPQ
jgi:phosphoglycolate phosphatase